MPTRLLILSDLHLEFECFTPSAGVDFDVAVLAGDIHSPGVQAVRWARAAFKGKPVIYVPGNHEHYRQDWMAQLARMREEAAGSSVHILERDECTLAGVRFLGTTLWTDFALLESQGVSIDHAAHIAEQRMNDFVLIAWRDSENNNLPQRFTPADAMCEHHRSRTWLWQRLNDASRPDLPVVVVTHHAPSPRSTHQRYEGDELNPAFASDLPGEYFGRAALWVHGHMHSSADYNVAGTRVICNPRGYPFRHLDAFENDAFDPGLVVQVG